MWKRLGTFTDERTGATIVDLQCSCCGERRGLDATLPEEVIRKHMRELSCAYGGRRTRKAVEPRR